MARALVLILALAAAACRLGEDRAPEAAPVAVTEPESCRPCHAAEVDRFAGSAHLLAARPFGDVKAPREPGAPMSDEAREVLSFRPGAAGMLVADAAGATEERTPTHVLGGVRREDFVATHADRRQVLPVSWSVTRTRWVHPVAEEIGGLPSPESPLHWTSPRRSHDLACSRCHALPAEGRPAMTCADCHGDASAHVERHAEGGDATTFLRDGLRRGAGDPLRGCGGCHATGSERPRLASLPGDAPLTDRLLPSTFASPSGVDRNFRMDGTPALGHGMEAQSLAASPCFVKGGATCTTCHDPHGGPGASLRDPDPDASCRSCHAAIAADAAGHAKHPVHQGPVPSSRAEPSGPAAGRLPGCVDCHAPALLPFGRGDLVRDHAISVPRPELDEANGMRNSCAGCHPGRPARELEAAMPRAAGERRRERRLRAFSGALRGEPVAEVVPRLAAVVQDESEGAWTRAAAAHLLALPGEGAKAALPALAAASESADPVLAMAALNARARIGGSSPELLARLSSEKDWRVALSLGAGLAASGTPRGMEIVEAIYADASLPPVARADAANELGVLLVQAGSCRRAATVLASSVATHPESVPAWLNLGVARACVGDGEGARRAFMEVLARQPDHDLARRNLASLDVATGATAAP